MISGFEKYHRLIDFQYIFMDLLRDYFILKLYYLFSQNLVNASIILCWALGRLHWVKMEVIYHVCFVSVFALMITYFFITWKLQVG